jgi:hypothetical protein
MVDFEVPTAPPLPILRPATLYYLALEDPSKRVSSHVPPPSALQTQASLEFIRRARGDPKMSPKPLFDRKKRQVPRRAIYADEFRCGICFRWIPSNCGKVGNVEHINMCWDKLRAKFREAKEQETWYLECMTEKENMEEMEGTKDGV